MIDSQFEYNPLSEKQGYFINLLVDNPQAWIVPWAQKLEDILSPFHTVNFIHDKKDLQNGNFAFLLGCTSIIPPNYLALNRHNIVVHESDLPRGKGFSPVAWQVLEGKNTIPVSLFEAVEDMDAGSIYLRDNIVLNGTELLPEIRKKQGIKTLEMIIKFLNNWPNIVPEEQRGEATIYRRRNTADDKLDIDKSLAEQFNHLRIVDNEKYPAWFEINGKKYILKIFQYSGGHV